MKILSVGGGAGKSLARPTFRCRRTESIVSLERGSVHVPNCKSFLVTEAERKHVRRRELSSSIFFLQGKSAEGNPRHSEKKN